MKLAFPASQLLISSSARTAARMRYHQAADTERADGAQAAAIAVQYWAGIALPRD